MEVKINTPYLRIMLFHPLLLLFLSVMLIPISLATPNSSEGKASKFMQTMVQGSAKDKMVGLDYFVDSMVIKAMKEQSLPGATISVVKNGQIIFLKGYGFSNVENRIPVDPEKSMFRIGSITKTMIALAIMQLVENGHLDLNTDINNYLTEFKIPNEFNKPITLKALLSHRAGFEDSVAGHLFVSDASKVLSPDKYLATYMPQRVREPGLASAYSNYGFGLMGYIVEQVSGMDLATYMEVNLFTPLGMEYTSIREPLNKNSFTQPISNQQKAWLATGYIKDSSGQLESKPFDFISHIAGAGAISSSARDMALYMITRLDNDSYSGGRLVNERTTKYMKTRLYDDRPLTTGIAHATFDSSFMGYKQYSHVGQTSTFSSNMVMFPELKLGVFISTNVVDSGTGLVASLPTSIFQHFYQRKETRWQGLPAIDESQIQKYTGLWMASRRSYTQIEKLGAIVQVVETSINSNGELIMTSPWGSIKLHEIGHGVFQQPFNDSPVYYFYEDDNGTPVRFSATASDFERISFIQSPNVFFLMLVLASFFSLSTLFVSWRRRSKGKKLRLLDNVGVLMSVTILAVVSIFAVIYLEMVHDQYSILHDFPLTSVKLLLWLVLIIATTTTVKLLGLPFIWKHPNIKLPHKLHYSFFTLSCLGLLFVFWVWNVIGFNYF